MTQQQTQKSWSQTADGTNHVTENGKVAVCGAAIVTVSKYVAYTLGEPPKVCPTCREYVRI